MVSSIHTKWLLRWSLPSGRVISKISEKVKRLFILLVKNGQVGIDRLQSIDKRSKRFFIRENSDVINLNFKILSKTFCSIIPQNTSANVALKGLLVTTQ